MKTILNGKIILGLILGLFLMSFPLFGADVRNTSIDVNLIIEDSPALGKVMENVAAWISGNLVDRILQDGDRITVWGAGGSAQIIYSGTIKGAEGRENVKKALKSLSAQGNSPDFSGALRAAVSRNPDAYTLLICASPAALSPTLLGPQADLVKYSRVEEFRGWRAMVIGLNIDSRVRKATTAFFAGT